MCHSRLCEGFVYVSWRCVDHTTPCLEAQWQLLLLLLLKAFGLREIEIRSVCYRCTCVPYILRVWFSCFYLLLSHQNPPRTWGFVCVVLGVGVISVIDAVAFLACMHRVSSPCLWRYNNMSNSLLWLTMLSSIGYKRTVILFYREKKIAESLFVHLKLILHPFLYAPDDVALELSPQMSFPEEHPPFWQTRHFLACPWVYKKCRTLIIITPSWWSDLHLKFDDNIYLKYHLSHVERIFNERLQRSGKYLLDTFVCSPHKHPEKKRNHVLLHLLSSVTRWHSLTVDAGPRVYKIFKKMFQRIFERVAQSFYNGFCIYRYGSQGGGSVQACHSQGIWCYPQGCASFSSLLFYLNPYRFLSPFYTIMSKLFQWACLIIFLEVSQLLSKMEALKYVNILCGERWEDDDDASNLPLVSCITLWDYGVLGLILETWNKLVLPELQHFDWYMKRCFYI